MLVVQFELLLLTVYIQNYRLRYKIVNAYNYIVVQ